MSEYTDFWKSLDLPADKSPKTRDFNTVASNADRLSLTDDEQYSLGWGPDALPEDWVKARAKEINDQIQADESTAILKRGLNKAPKTQEELDAEAAAKALEDAKAKEGVNTPGAPTINNGGGGDGNGGPTGGDPYGNGATDGSNNNSYGLQGPGLSVGFNTSDAAKGAVKGGLAGGVPGALLGGLVGGVSLSTSPGYSLGPAENSRSARDARDAAEAGRGAGMDGATEGSAGSTAADSTSPDGPDGNNAGQGFGGEATGSGPGSGGQTGGDMGGYGGADNGY